MIVLEFEDLWSGGQDIKYIATSDNVMETGFP